MMMSDESDEYGHLFRRTSRVKSFPKLSLLALFLVSPIKRQVSQHPQIYAILQLQRFDLISQDDHLLFTFLLSSLTFRSLTIKYFCKFLIKSLLENIGLLFFL